LTDAAETWVQVSSEGLISKTITSETPKYSGKSIPILVQKANTHQTLFLVGKDGMSAAIAIHTLPEAEVINGGNPLDKATTFREPDKLVAGFVKPDQTAGVERKFILTVSKKGMVKKSPMEDLPGPSSQMFAIAKINAGDELLQVFSTSGNEEIFLATRLGAAIRFSEEEVRSMGLSAAGVNGIKLQGDDDVVAAGILINGSEILLLDSEGNGWRLPINEFPLQGRYGRGVSAAKLAQNAELFSGFTDSQSRLGLVEMVRGNSQNYKMDDLPLGKRTKIGQVLVKVKPRDSMRRMITYPLNKKLTSPRLKTGKITTRKTKTKVKSANPGSGSNPKKTQPTVIKPKKT
jgi:DNA gyrase subunit A